MLRTEIEANEARWSEALDLLEREELRASLGSPAADPPIDPAETLLLLQALHHGDDHRAQVCSTLGALELEVPDLDVWAFWDERR